MTAFLHLLDGCWGPFIGGRSRVIRIAIIHIFTPTGKSLYFGYRRFTLIKVGISDKISHHQALRPIYIWALLLHGLYQENKIAFQKILIFLKNLLLKFFFDIFIFLDMKIWIHVFWWDFGYKFSIFSFIFFLENNTNHIFIMFVV